MVPRIVILLGPPACGKGTQARELQSRFGWRAFSTGAAIRSHVEAGSPFGVKFKKMLGSAYLLPDAVIMDLVRAELRGHLGGLVLDGFPRTLVQGALFDAYCAETKLKIDAVVVFEATEEELAARMEKRLTCCVCGGTFTADGTGFTAGSPCPHCGHSLERRRDDSPDVFRERFQEFRRLTLPLVDFYEPRGIVHKVNAMTPAPELADQLEAYFASLP